MPRWVLVLATVVAMSIPLRAAAQATQTGNVTNGSSVYYSFTPLASGQFTATLSWDAQPANLFMILVCGTSDPMTFGIGGGQLDRTARLESGLLGLFPCVMGVSGTSSSTAAFRLNLQRSTDQLSTVQPATVQGLALARSGSVDVRLIEQAERTAATLRANLP